MLTLWPVFLWSVVQEDVVRLFELDDVVTLPAQLVDAAVEPGWPQSIGVQTTVTMTGAASGHPWARTAGGLSVRAALSAPAGTNMAIRAALNVPIETTALLSFVTGTVRRIELASVPMPEVRESITPIVSYDEWTLSETPVAPVSFRNGFGQSTSETWDQGILVHLDLLSPRCRCRDLAGLRDPEANRYARRHLRAIAEDRTAETIRYVCPETGASWIRHRWKRPRHPGDPLGVPYEPMILTRQQTPPTPTETHQPDLA